MLYLSQLINGKRSLAATLSWPGNKQTQENKAKFWHFDFMKS